MIYKLLLHINCTFSPYLMLVMHHDRPSHFQQRLQDKTSWTKRHHVKAEGVPKAEGGAEDGGREKVVGRAMAVSSNRVDPVLGKLGKVPRGKQRRQSHRRKATRGMGSGQLGVLRMHGLNMGGMMSGMQRSGHGTVLLIGTVHAATTL